MDSQPRKRNGGGEGSGAVKLKRSETERMYNSLKALPAPYSTRLPKPVWVMAHHSQEALALAVVRSCTEWQANALKNGLDNETDINDTRQVEYKSILEWKKFQDGFPNLFIRKVKEMAGKDVIFIASFHDVEVIFEQLSMLYVLPRYLAHSVTVILPYFPTGTMERVDLEGQVATAKTLATMLSQIPPTGRGPCQIMIYDIHALQERFYFTTEIVPRMESAVPLLMRELEAWKFGSDAGGLAIAFPDDGAEKRFGRLFPAHWPRIVCGKHRDGDKRIVVLKEGEPVDKHVVIVDDLVQTGGTLKEAGKMLLGKGAKSVSAYVTHAVFPRESWRRFSHEEDSFWITDSLPHAVEIVKHPPYKLLSLAPHIAECLLGFDLKQWD